MYKSFALCNANHAVLKKDSKQVLGTSQLNDHVKIIKDLPLGELQKFLRNIHMLEKSKWPLVLGSTTIVRITVIEELKNTDTFDKKEVKHILEKHEDFWMIKLKTIPLTILTRSLILRRLKSKEKPKIWKPKDLLFCD